jgi:hypothetical protein
MQIYSSQNQARYLDKLREYNCGVMLTPSYKVNPSAQKELKDFDCALDNGAFTCFKKGYPFQSRMFLSYMEKCFAEQYKLDFIVCPDIVAGGMRSVEFSLEWASGELKTAPSLAFVVQDGMTPENLSEFKIGDFKNIKYIFIGGTKPWKMSTLSEWRIFSNGLNLKLHVGQIGTIDRLIQCHESGVDSIDSQNFSRNNTWNYLREYKEYYSGDQQSF